MTTQTEQALRMALDALAVATTPLAKDRQEVLRAIAACKEALAAPQGEPVAYYDRPSDKFVRIKDTPHGVFVYTHPAPAPLSAM